MTWVTYYSVLITDETLKTVLYFRPIFPQIIPPKGWIPRKNYSTVDVDIPAPIHQVITGTQGKIKAVNFDVFRDKSMRKAW